jgi:hypothetical protein
MDVYKEHNDVRMLPILDAYMQELEKQDPLYHQVLQAQADAEQK